MVTRKLLPARIFLIVPLWAEAKQNYPFSLPSFFERNTYCFLTAVMLPTPSI